MFTKDIQSLFNNFQLGFKVFDLNLVTACYNLPCTLNTPDKISVIKTKLALEDEVNDIFSQLKNEGFDRLELKNSSCMQLTDEIILVNIDWKFYDNTNQVFSEFSAFYHLVCANDKKVKIINATSHQISNSQRLQTSFSLKDNQTFNV